MQIPELASRLSAALSLDIPPVALTFVDEAPQGIPTASQVMPSACSFWRQAESSTFFASDTAHFNCPIGAMVMGFDLPEEVGSQLGELMTVMCNCGYVEAQEASSIPTIGNSHAGIVYGPLSEHPLSPDLVVLWLTPQQVMLCNEAAGTANWSRPAPQTTGRPGCAALPAAVNSNTPVISFGCTGMRIFTEISNDRMLLALPASQLAEYVAAMETIHTANQNMADFYQAHKAALVGQTDV